MRKITRAEFKRAVGCDPVADDLDRVNCDKAGTIGHWSCGWCENHNAPEFYCGCAVRYLALTNDSEYLQAKNQLDIKQPHGK